MHIIIHKNIHSLTLSHYEAMSRDDDVSPKNHIREIFNEFLTKLLSIAAAHQIITVDPTKSYILQENTIAERTNRTLMARVQVTLAVAQIPFEKHWSLHALDTIIRSNSCLQIIIEDTPLRLCERYRKPNSSFRSLTPDLR